MPVDEGLVVEKRDAFLNGLSPTAYWQLLTLCLEPVPDPKNDSDTLQPPTEIDSERPNAKYGFVETFKQPKFTGVVEAFEVRRRRMKYASQTKHTQVIDITVGTRERGRPCPAFLRKYGLDRISHPADWFNSVLPLTNKDNFE